MCLRPVSSRHPGLLEPVHWNARLPADLQVRRRCPRTFACANGSPAEVHGPAAFWRNHGFRRKRPPPPAALGSEGKWWARPALGGRFVCAPRHGRSCVLTASRCAGAGSICAAGVMPLFRLFSGRSSKQSKGAGSGCTSTIHDPAFAVSATVGHVSLSPEAYRKKRLDPFNYRYESGPQGEEVGACWFVFDVNAFSSSRAPDPTPTTI